MAATSGADSDARAVSTGYTRYTVNRGYIEARIRLPNTPGSWPAFWGLYSGWPPEADGSIPFISTPSLGSRILILLTSWWVFGGSTRRRS